VILVVTTALGVLGAARRLQGTVHAEAHTPPVHPLAKTHCPSRLHGWPLRFQTVHTVVASSQ
jgi:hypothetical protein